MGCNSKKTKKELIRIVKDKQNNVSLDRTGKMEGRGAYICDEIKCLEKVIKSKRLEKECMKGARNSLRIRIMRHY
jgi:predicted RNA-binding protein YlxR (DUF448 family)